MPNNGLSNTQCGHAYYMEFLNIVLKKGLINTHKGCATHIQLLYILPKEELTNTQLNLHTKYNF
jgi:hypothetical protein